MTSTLRAHRGSTSGSVHGLDDFLALCRHPGALALAVAARPARSASLEALAVLAPRLALDADPSPAVHGEPSDDSDDFDDLEGHGLFDDYQDDDPVDAEDVAFWATLLAAGVSPCAP